MAKKRVYFRIGLDLPKDATIKDMREYIASAVGWWRAGFSTDNPIFDLDPKSVKVSSAKQVRQIRRPYVRQHTRIHPRRTPR